MAELRKIHTTNKPYLKNNLSLSPKPRSKIAPFSHIYTDEHLSSGRTYTRESEWKGEEVKSTKKESMKNTTDGLPRKQDSGFSDRDLPLETISLSSDLLDDRKRNEIAKVNSKYGGKMGLGGPRPSQHVNYCPHVILMIIVIIGIIFMFCSVGSSQWMIADVSGLSVTYGLFEVCVTNTQTDVSACEDFDWPEWLQDSAKAKMNAVKTLSLISVVLGGLFLPGWLIIVITGYYDCCSDVIRRSCVIVVDIFLWLLVICGGISSLLYLTSMDTLQAYPHSSVLWPPIVYCAGWGLVLVSRLIVAACCDVHRDDESSLPFA